MQTPFGGYLHNTNHHNAGLIESYCVACHKFVGASGSEDNLRLAETAHRSDCKQKTKRILEKTSHDVASKISAFLILSLGYDATLMPIRSMLLRQAGYEVIEAYSCEAALKEIECSHLDLLLICHTVPAGEQDALIGRVKSVQPKLPIVCLAVGQFQPLRKGCVPACSYAPEFLDDVNEVLRRA
jgi:CheY-like chemotaxis protein